MFFNGKMKMQIEMFCQHFLKIYEATHIVIVYMTHNANSIFLSCLRHKEPNFLFIFSARKRMKCDILGVSAVVA